MVKLGACCSAECPPLFWLDLFADNIQVRISTDSKQLQLAVCLYGISVIICYSLYWLVSVVVACVCLCIYFCACVCLFVCVCV